MRELAVLFLHLLATIARLAGSGGARSVIAESVLVKQQLLILNRSRTRSPNLRLADRIVVGVCAGQRTRESQFVSMAAALLRAVSNADRCVKRVRRMLFGDSDTRALSTD